MTDLGGQVAVVTGGGGGIGSAICRRLAAAGAQIVITYNRDQGKARAAANTLAGGGHLVIGAPVDDAAAQARLANGIAEKYGRLDILVNNAGFTKAAPHADLDALDDETIDQIFRVNWRGAFASIRALHPLLSADAGGVIINISSIAGRTGVGGAFRRKEPARRGRGLLRRCRWTRSEHRTHVLKRPGCRSEIAGDPGHGLAGLRQSPAILLMDGCERRLHTMFEFCLVHARNRLAPQLTLQFRNPALQCLRITVSSP